jgi:hypothetical protein
MNLKEEWNKRAKEEIRAYTATIRRTMYSATSIFHNFLESVASFTLFILLFRDLRVAIKQGSKLQKLLQHIF